MDLAELKNLITESQNSIVQKIDLSQQSLETKLGDLSNKVNEEVQNLKTSVEEFKQNISENISSIHGRLNSHEQRLANSEDDINRLKYACDLRLTGIPHSQNENLVSIFNTLSSIIGFDCSNNAAIPFIERIPFRHKTTGIMTASPTILFHFTSIQFKQWFYSLYLNKMPLKGEVFGFQNVKNIILGENLTQKNANIFKLAKTMKNDNKIAQTFTQDGLVKIRFIKGPKQHTYTIRNAADLEHLVEEHNSNRMDIQQVTITTQPNAQPHVQTTLHSLAQSQPANHAHSHTHTSQSVRHDNSFELLPNERNQHTIEQHQSANANGTHTITTMPNQLNERNEMPFSPTQHQNATLDQSTPAQQQQPPS